MDYNLKDYISYFPVDSEKLWNLNPTSTSSKQWHLCDISEINTVKSELSKILN